MTPRVKPLFLTLLSLLITAAILFILLHKQPPPKTSATTLPATTQSFLPASKPAPPYIPKSLYDVVKHDLPQIATTQPLVIPLDLRDASHYILAGPLYLDPIHLDLWLTRPTAPPIADILKSAPNQQTHVSRDTVLYIHYQPDPSTGSYLPNPIISTPTGPTLITPTHSFPLPNHNYDFSHALSLNNQILLPTPTSIIILTLQNNNLTESNHPLPQLATSNQQLATSPSPLLLPTPQGLLAYTPSTSTTQGSTGFSRYSNNTWTDFTPTTGYPQKILHLIPLLDGSLLALIPTTPHHIQLQLLTLDTPTPTDTPTITRLVESLSNPNPQTREQSFAQLTQYGPSIFPTLQKLLPDQPPESQIRLQQLLRSQLKPTLGPATLLDDQLDLASRSPDGSALFYSSAGVSIPSSTDTPDIITPAWLSIRPGQPIRLLPDSLTHDLTPTTATLTPYQSEWIVTTDATGPSRFLGNQLTPLLPPNERAFSHFEGIDHRGRWLFTKPTPSGVGSPSQSAIPNPQSAILIIDPTLPTPTPRLPAWTMTFPDPTITIGWDHQNYPSLQSGDSAYSLTQSDWTLLDKSNPFSNTPEKKGDASHFHPSTTPSSHPTSEPSTPPILTTPTAQYSNARTEIILTTSNQQRATSNFTYPLPPEHYATMDPTLIETDHHLFLFNQPGKCVRFPLPLKNPLTPDAVFTDNIPNTDHPLRIWLDPANRICIIPDPRHLILLFPTGIIPDPIQQKMPPDQLDPPN